jgi:hypothetical protein
MDHDEDCPVCRKYLGGYFPWTENDRSWFEDRRREQAQEKHDQ